MASLDQLLGLAHEAPAAGLPKKSTQDDRQGKKRPKDGRVANELLPFSVYVEKFDSANSKIKLSASKWIDIRAGIFKTFMDSPEVHDKLKEDCEKRLYNGEIVIFYTKSDFAQNLVIKTINETLRLPGIKARGPYAGTRPNLHVHRISGDP